MSCSRVGLNIDTPNPYELGWTHEFDKFIIIIIIKLNRKIYKYKYIKKKPKN